MTLEVAGSGEHFSVRRSGLMRTARALMDGEVLVPCAVWDGSEGRPTSVAAPPGRISGSWRNRASRRGYTRRALPSKIL